jgi:hypothetical protein
VAERGRRLVEMHPPLDGQVVLPFVKRLDSETVAVEERIAGRHLVRE